jgi:PAS domain-containing protein
MTEQPRTQRERQTDQIEQLHDNPDLADALESDQFKQFLDQVPVAVAVAVSELRQSEVIVYANLEFERLSARTGAEIVGQPWSTLPGGRDEDGRHFPLGEAITRASDFIGTFTVSNDGGDSHVVDAWSNISRMTKARRCSGSWRCSVTAPEATKIGKSSSSVSTTRTRSCANSSTG